MSVNTVSTANSANNSNSSSSANNASKTGKTGKHETATTATSYAPEKKTEAIETPKDSVEISESALDTEKAKGNNKDYWKDFDMDAFQTEIRNKLMESIHQSKKALQDAGVEFVKYDEDSILYSGVPKGTKAAEVPEYWNAEKTSQRIVDFAMSFRSMAPELSDEEYIAQVRKSVQLGYKLAKKDVGSMPGPSAQLFNDTYNLTMKKFDDLVEQAKKKSGEA
ncbi:MAG: hypothetical protein LBC64_06075 [Fibromonadaceae bacterium]|nr:hypothetical protein [Fibromonadaceae bacterium]